VRLVTAKERLVQTARQSNRGGTEQSQHGVNLILVKIVLQYWNQTGFLKNEQNAVR
jgi:hypothetical protein